ncbi:uncharacterized protein LOC111601631 isoform X2 [Drosophila hydei]|uniref:Uncharacterized protein LOC111601631 isoform X2 n=1 Tax=Drosophila hydei TaxID=7224 RepID=A0A6J1M4P8_DROHY|nr:uncharacterized protein LOC111601631 isoform X2 [Drosophila hydei]
MRNERSKERKAKHTQTDRQEELHWLQDMMPSMPELESLPIIECARNAYFSEQLQSILSVALVTCGFLISFYICLDVLKNL